MAEKKKSFPVVISSRSHSDRRTLPRSALRPKPVSAGGRCRFSWRSGVFLGGVKQHGVFLVCCGLMMIKTYFNEIQATCCGIYPKN